LGDDHKPGGAAPGHHGRHQRVAPRRSQREVRRLVDPTWGGRIPKAEDLR
jgi:hypothetical protein